ncbi:MAG: hypothetical protein AAFV53_06965 [Myxococcota bacterium]
MLALMSILFSGAVHAKSWCAAPLIAHEWGVEVLRGDGQPPVGVPMPSWFHRGVGSPDAVGEPVRHLPPDSGIRTLPVVQFYAPPTWGSAIPVGLEVGFSDGEASVWFPQVDRRISAAEANGPAAAAARSSLLAQRALRSEGFDRRERVGADPTRQLGWDALSLLRDSPTGAHRAEVTWVEALREMPQALWVQRGDEVERFVFYEADTREQPALILERGDQWSPTRPHYVLRNRSDWPVHEVVLVADGVAWQAPSIPAGASAGFLLTDPLQPAAVAAWLRGRWSGAARSPESYRWTVDDCVMMRDPAIPVEVAEGHRLYPGEVDVLMDVWAARLFQGAGVHLIYREDTAALDALMPVSLYTDMRHFVEWRRLGVVLVEGLQLP